MMQTKPSDLERAAQVCDSYAECDPIFSDYERGYVAAAKACSDEIRALPAQAEGWVSASRGDVMEEAARTVLSLIETERMSQQARDTLKWAARKIRERSSPPPADAGATKAAVSFGPPQQSYPGGPIYRVGTSTGVDAPADPAPSQGGGERVLTGIQIDPAGFADGKPFLCPRCHGHFDTAFRGGLCRGCLDEVEKAEAERSAAVAAAPSTAAQEQVSNGDSGLTGSAAPAVPTFALPEEPRLWNSREDAETDFCDGSGLVRKSDYDALRQSAERLQGALTIKSARVQELAQYRTRLQGELAEAQKEIEIDNKLLAERDRLLEAIPHCDRHGDKCIPNALEWVEKAKAAERTVAEQAKKLATSGNYVADDEVHATKVEFANGRTVEIVDGYLSVGRKA